MKRHSFDLKRGRRKGNSIKRYKFLYIVALALAPQLCFAQQPAFLLNTSADGIAKDSSLLPEVLATTPVVKKQQSLTARWLDLTDLSHSERYRNSFNQGGFHMFEDGQERSIVAGRIKLDEQARYTIGFRASSGRYFNWAYADFAGQGRTSRVKAGQADGMINAAKTPAEVAESAAAKIADPVGFAVSSSPSSGWEFYVRELYLSATPVKPLTVEFGSMDFERGYGSEITTFDNDGYISGERVRIQDPKHLFFDQVGFTSAFFGSINTPNLFARGGDFTSSNYRQVFAKKRVNKRVAFSADYTWSIGTEALRQGAIVETRETKIVDSVRVEAYQRLNSVTLQGLSIGNGAGFAVTADKRIDKRLNIDGGFASIDANYTAFGGSRYLHSSGFSMNGDTYGIGQRGFTHVSFQFAPGVTAFGFYTHAVGSGIAARELDLNKQGLNAGLTFDLKAWANIKNRVF